MKLPLSLRPLSVVTLCFVIVQLAWSAGTTTNAEPAKEPTYQEEMKQALASYPSDITKRLEEIRKVNEKWAKKHGTYDELKAREKRVLTGTRI